VQRQRNSPHTFSNPPQKAPSRGNADAVNVHPFEFLSGCVTEIQRPLHSTEVSYNACSRCSLAATVSPPPTSSNTKTTSREYNHLLAIHLVAQVLPLHALTVLVFIVLGGFLASLNHTRFDIKAPGALDLLYQVRFAAAILRFQ
jgi:hypothetical protein